MPIETVNLSIPDNGLALDQVTYDFGRVVPENDAEAVKWYRLAAEQRHVNAQYTLGLMYYNGVGVPQNYVKSYVWLSVATAQGNENANAFRDAVSELWLIS